MSYWLAITHITALSLIQPPAASDQPNFGFRFAETRMNTVEVTYLDPKGLAQRMGLKASDTILEINGQQIQSKGKLLEALKDLRGNYEIVVKRVKITNGVRNIVSEPPLKGEIKRSKTGEYYVLPR